jgi:ABC-type multidrug transport system fused ATPase/permease subunit
MENARRDKRYRGLRGIMAPFRHIISRHALDLWVSIIFMIFIDILAYTLPLLIRHVTDEIYPQLGPPGMLRPLFIFGGLIIVAGLVRGVMVHLMIRSFWGLAEKVVRDVRDALFEKLQHLPAQFYDRARTGDLMSRVSGDVQMLRNFFAFGIEHRVRVVLITVTVLGLMVWQNWRLALVVYSIIPFIMYMVLYFSTRMNRAVREKYLRTADLSSFLQENLYGIRIIKALAVEKRQVRAFADANRQLTESSTEAADLQARMNPVFILTNTIGSLIIVLYGGWQIVTGTGGMTLGTLLGFMTYLAIIGFPMYILAFNTSTMSLASGAAARIDQVLSQKDQRQDNTGTRRDRIRGKLEFENLRFSYPESKAPVLDDVNVCIKPGERVAIFGLTGSGKSSLISLVPRFYEPDRGRILLDGRPLAEWDLEYLRSHIGMVLQESFLFSMSIMDNIAYGRPDACREEIVDAAKAARIHDYIMTLPDGYDSTVGEFGLGLSGGQKQRIAIARALLKDPSLLILDDCTSSLDSRTEWEIQRELRQLMAGRTTLIIAQRISTLRLADRIIVLHEGRVDHMDSHEALLEKSPVYRSAYLTQMNYASLAEDAMSGGG